MGKWKRLNGLDSVKPMVWLTNVPWHEMDVDGELTLERFGLTYYGCWEPPEEADVTWKSS